jgi:hypothetical protein
MTQWLNRERRTAALGGLFAVVLAALAAAPALAASSGTPLATPACPAPQLSQPLLWAGDAHWYTLMPGEATDSFTGAGWTLTGGASIITTTLAGGQTGTVLDLPSGSQAISPTICVASDYATGRTMVRNVVGAEGVAFSVSYVGTRTATAPQNTGDVHGSHNAWTLSNPVNLHPANGSAWQYVKFTFTPAGKTSDFQIYNFYVDPRNT